MTMDPELMRTIQFNFSDPHQRKIYDGLNRVVSAATASFYKDACKINSGNYDLDSKTHLIGHLFREILGALTNILLPEDYKPSRSKNENVRKIKKILGVYKVDTTQEAVQLWLDIAKNKKELGLHRWAHRSGLLSVRVPDKQFDELWQKVQILFEFLLDLIEKNFVHYVTYLDTLLVKPQITDGDLSEFKEKIPCNAVTLGYFFERIDKPDCLPALIKQGFFKNPTPPVEHPDGGVSFPYWSQMTYLIKLSKISSAQANVLQVCLGIETDNIRTQADILEVANSLPGKMSIQLVNKSYNYLAQINSWFHPEKYGLLMVHLATEGYKSEAIELAKKVLTVKPDPRKPVSVEGHTLPYEPKALFDDWHYERIIKEDYPAFVDLVGIAAINVLVELIEDYVNISDNERRSGSKDDYSEIWRPAIEDHTQNHNHGVRDLLITALRNACEQFLQSHPDQTLTVIEALDSRGLNILKRLSLHLLRLFPKGAEKKIVQELVNKEEFRNETKVTHEYFLLAEAHGKLLKKEYRDQLWSWIMNGANVEDYKKWLFKNGYESTEEKVQKYNKNWQMYHLMPFRKIDSKWKKYFDSLINELGEPKFPSFSSWMESGSRGPTSAISNEQLKQMEPYEVVNFLESWDPPANDPLDRSREGTGRQLTEQVASDPKKWLKSTSAFALLDPTYVRSLLRGYHDALKQGRRFYWKPVLDLCQVILTKPIKLKKRKVTVPFGEDPDWSWCRNTIVELLSEGMLDHVGKLPVSFRKQNWKLIEKFTNDSDPTIESEKEYLTSHKDPLSLAINSTRGDAMLAAIQYGVWLKKFADKETQEKWSLKKDAPELLKVLDEHLDIRKDPSVAIRAIYGEKLGTLAWLDKNWVIANQDGIFPANEEQKQYFDAAWETYITFVQPYGELLRILEKQYVRAIREVGKHADTKQHIESPDQRLAQHLMIFYWIGEIDISDNNGLITQFFSTSPIELKSEAIEFVGRSLKDSPEVPVKVKKRLKSLWEQRLALAKNPSKGQKNLEELSGFSWWFASGKFNERWLIEQLMEILTLGCEIEGDYLVMKKLVEMAGRYSLEVIKCSTMMTEQDKKGWGILHWKAELQEIMKIVLASKRHEAILLARELANKLVAKGHIEFKSLV